MRYVAWKYILGALALFLTAGSGRADDLRLADGTELNGWFLGGTHGEVWFQTLDASAKSYPLKSYPVEIVDALTFRPIRGAPTPERPLDPRLPGPSGQTRTSAPLRVHTSGRPGDAWRAPAAPQRSTRVLTAPKESEENSHGHLQSPGE